MNKNTMVALMTTILLAGCASTQTSSGINAEKVEPQIQQKVEPIWTPLFEGGSLSYNATNLANLKLKYGEAFSEMKLSNGALLDQDDLDGYLGKIIEGMPVEQKDSVLDGFTRFFHEYDMVNRSVRFEPIRYLSEPYANASYVSLAGSIKDGKSYSYMEIKYFGKSWVFADNVMIAIDEERIELPSPKVLRDHYGGNVWEHVLLSISSRENRELAQKIVESDQTIIRFSGEQYYKDIVVTPRMKQDMGMMLKAIDIIENR